MERVSSVLVKEPARLKGRWLRENAEFDGLYIEIGCGKGSFTCGTAKALPGGLLLALERSPDALVMAMEKACAAGLKNVRFINMDAALLDEVLDEGEADRIYINFCDPWPKSRHAKRRLTAPAFLEIYKRVLKAGGELHFKTDNIDLFRYSLAAFEEAGLELLETTQNLHENGIAGHMTDYEAKFYAEGKPICRAVARRRRGEEG